MQISVQKFDTDEQREGVKVPSVANICIFKWLKCGTWHPTQPAHASFPPHSASLSIPSALARLVPCQRLVVTFLLAHKSKIEF